MVINGDLLSIEVMRDITSTSKYSLIDFLDEFQFIDLHNYIYIEYDSYFDFVNALIFGIERTAKAYQE